MSGTRINPTSLRYAGVLVTLTLVPSLPAAAHGDDSDATIAPVGRPGRAAGRHVRARSAGGRLLRRSDDQRHHLPARRPSRSRASPAIVDGRRPGEFLAMPDNGFGNKANSGDFLHPGLLPASPTSRRPAAGPATVAVGEFIEFRDPNGLIGFPIVNELTADRLLTGADIDPESIQRGSDGDLWVGDEFGPWILHFDATRPSCSKRRSRCPTGCCHQPTRSSVGAAPTVNGSRGIEAMAISPERAAPHRRARGRRARRRPDVAPRATGTTRATARSRGSPTTASKSPATSSPTPRRSTSTALLVIERDGGRGLTATFRRGVPHRPRSTGHRRVRVEDARRRPRGDPRPRR